MTEQKPQRKGRDFAIAFFGSLFLAVLSSLWGSLFFMTSTGIGLIAATIFAFIRHRKFIGIGILTALVGAPLLLLGSCYAFSLLY